MRHFIRPGWQKLQAAIIKFTSHAALSAFLATTAIGTIAARADTADDLLKQTAPYKWIDPLIPEKLPALTFIKDSSDLERAKVEVFHGRYKQSLITLAKFHPEKPQEIVDFALTRAEAMDALGRQQPALKELSDETVAA